MSDFAPSRGTHDLLPPDGGVMRALYDRAAEIARVHGFRYVETPGFEATDVFARTSGATSDVVSKEMYTFTDRGDRSLTLRPEGTAPVVRAYLHDRQRLGVPFKAYYLTRMYRYSRPQAGRYREHRQFGVEVLGTDAPAADVDVMVVGDAVLRSLGLRRYHVELNSLGDEMCRPAYREALLAYLRAHRDQLRDEHKDRFEDNPLRVLDCKDEACRAVAAGAPTMVDHLCDECRTAFDAVQKGLADAGIAAMLAPTLVRGLDYYTRTAFEFVSDALQEGGNQQQSTVFGGGRYDGLAEAIGGPRVPGVGFGMGLERVLLAVADEQLAPPSEPPLAVFVVGLGDEARATGLRLVADLRRAGVSADAAYEDRPMKAQLKMADKAGARFAAIVGADELAAGTVSLRRLADGVQQSVPLAEAAGRVAGDGA
ncbi:MAG TPA: histidine--tRNA ligase [Actinomycetota bacterium]|jgi:histidyl-tRNA synthetase|nr:histidine--tRNA ligase [Actinomycetota bacterium]